MSGGSHGTCVCDNLRYFCVHRGGLQKAVSSRAQAAAFVGDGVQSAAIVDDGVQIAFVRCAERAGGQYYVVCALRETVLRCSRNGLRDG